MSALNVIVHHVVTLAVVALELVFHHTIVQFALVIVGAVTVGFAQLLADVQYTLFDVKLVLHISVAPFLLNVAVYCL